MTITNYFQVVRVVAAIGIIATAVIQSVLYPGPMDVYTGAAVGIAVYALWRA